MKNTHYLLIAILAAVVVGTTVWFATKAQNGKTESNSNTETQTQTLSNYNTDNYDYDLSLVLENGKFKDYSLIRTSKKINQEETVIKSISDAISQIQQDNKYTLSLLAEPSGSNKIYFQEIVYGSDAPSRDIFAFNVNENKFTKLTSSEIAKGLAFVKVSPDQKMLFSKPADDQNGNDQILYLVDLDKDKYEAIVNLTGNETLNAGRYAMSSYSDIKWIDNNKIQYAVYDQSKKPAGEYDATSILDDLFIENREVIIK